ncbi:hypothetical protein ACVU7I_15470 [Patulibacter sp. S7RM1-6]
MPAADAAAWKRERTVSVPNAVGADVTPGGETVVAVDGGSGATGVRRYSRAGRRVGGWSLEWRPNSGIAVDGATVVVARDDAVGAQLVAFDRSGRKRGETAVVDPAPIPGDPDEGREIALVGIDVDARGERYVAYTGSTLGVQRLDRAGRRLAAFGASGSGPGQFETSPSVASDGRGNVYVADVGLNRVQRFTSAGVLLGGWGQAGTRTGRLNAPRAIATDRRGHVWVGDESRGVKRLQRFTPKGRFVEQIRLPRDLSRYVVGIGFDRRDRLHVVTGGQIRDGHLHVYARKRSGRR